MGDSTPVATPSPLIYPFKIKRSLLMHCYVHNNMVKGSILLAFAISCILSMATTTNVGRKHLFIIIIEYTPTKGARYICYNRQSKGCST